MSIISSLLLFMNLAANNTSLTKSIFRELPYNGVEFIQLHGQFNNSLNSVLPTKKNLDRLTSIYDLDLFSLNINNNIDPDRNFSPQPTRCKYYSPHSFSKLQHMKSFHPNFSVLHSNIRSLKRNLDQFQNHLLSELNFHFHIIAVTETRIYNEDIRHLNVTLANYNFEFVPTPLAAGGVGMYIDDTLPYKVIEKTANEAFQALWLEIQLPKKPNVICGVIYRQHNSPERFLTYFEQTIERIISAGKTILVLGDMNINILKAETCRYAQRFLNSLQSYYLLPTIDKPTRVYNNSATLIDNIFTNKLDNNFLSGNIVSDLTDHFTQFCIFSSSTKIIQTAKVVTRDYSKFSNSKFLHDISLINWNLVLPDSNNDVNNLFSMFYNKLNKIVNKHAPFIALSRRKAKQMAKPWISKGLKKSIRIKNELFYSGDENRYKLYRNKIVTLCRLSKRNFYHNYFEENVNNMRKTWNCINDLIGHKKKGKKMIFTLKRPDNRNLCHKQTEIPDILNRHFAFIGHELASKIPHSSVHFSRYLPNCNNAKSFAFDLVLATEIEAEIKLTPLNKAHGLYSCPTRLLRVASHIISKPLATIINKSVENGVYPSKLKHAKIVPIYKSDDETDPSNYRPISLLSVFNRIFEKMMHKRLKSFLDLHDVLYENQYGFREKRSTQHALVDIVNKIQYYMDKKLFSCGIFIDLKKAFDTVDLIIQFYCVSWNIMVLGGSVINGSPLIYLDESKRLKLGLIFLNPKKLFVVFHRVPYWALFCFFYMLMISITLLTNLAFSYLLTILTCFMLTKI